MPSCIFPPALIYIGAAILVPSLRGRIRDVFILLVPVIAFAQLLTFTPGEFWTIPFLDDYQLILLKVELIRLCFAYVFVILSFLATLYALHIKQPGQHVAGLFYVGASLGVVFAGDYFTLFVFWELMAVSSAAVILSRNNRSSRHAAYRYLLVHIAGGACLMAGIVFQLAATDSIAVVTPAPGLPFYLILIGFCLNAAVPPLSAWLSDAYPEASVTGAIYLTAYTTKTAVLVLALVFSGTEILIWAGAIMTLYGVVFAMLENDIRRLLGYHIISQVGYMVCGVGLGTELAVDGATSHAFSHILYKGVLFMGAGAVIHATGRRRMSELGGILRKMPLTFILYMIGAFSIAGAPGWNGFISKSMIITAASDVHMPVIELMLVLASIGTFLSTGLKLPYYTFIAPDRGIKVGRLPKNMTAAMIGGAFLCTMFGIFPDLLYRLLPFASEYHPYTADHIFGSLGCMIATGLVFMIFARYLGGHMTITTDTDWFYRKAGNYLLRFTEGPLDNGAQAFTRFVVRSVENVTNAIYHPGSIIRTSDSSAAARGTLIQSIGIGVGLTSVVGIMYLIFFYFSV